VSALLERLSRTAEATGRAPGRVNLIGEHTDYNGGYVLPTVIPQSTTVEIAARGDREVRVASATVDPEGAVETYTLGAERRGRGWLDYVQGVTATLAAEGHVLGGFDAAIVSDVPIGSGVSSSAALQVALLRALRNRFGLTLGDLALALVVQRSENTFVGARVGIMDPMASSLGRAGLALFIDAHSLAWRHVPLPADLEIAVIDSGLPHQHATGGYNRRREECERACALLGVTQLRDLGSDDEARVAGLPAPLDRRVRHVVTENGRVLAAVEALADADLAAFGRLLDASHRSLRDDYEVSTPEIDALARALRESPGVLGARLTGGGFGGAVLGAVERGRSEEAAALAATRYARETGVEPAILVPRMVAPRRAGMPIR
jgi:galactokinase